MPSNNPKYNSDNKARNFVGGNNIGGVVGDQGKVRIRELKVFQGEKIQIIQGDNVISEIDSSNPFFDVYCQANTIKSPDRSSIITNIDEIRSEVEKGKNASESFLTKRLKNINKMAPDIFEVVIATLTNPVNGFALALRKIAEKAKQEVITH